MQKKNQPKRFESKKVSDGKSYADSASNKQTAAAPAKTVSTTVDPMIQRMEAIMKTLQEVTARLDRIEYAKHGAIPKRK
jgi:hypothetical protein